MGSRNTSKLSVPGKFSADGNVVLIRSLEPVHCNRTTNPHVFSTGIFMMLTYLVKERDWAQDLYYIVNIWNEKL